MAGGGLRAAAGALPLAAPPAARPGHPAAGRALAALDRALLGEVPAVAVAGRLSPAWIEWFAVAYSCHFVLVALGTLPSVLAGQGPWPAASWPGWR
ncbi:MAG: hypothetical protein R3F43_11835 [bacterium]